MSEDEENDTPSPRTSKRLGEYRIPGLEMLASQIATASTNGALFCLVEEMDLLLADYLKEKGELPASGELAAIILQAVRRIVDK